MRTIKQIMASLTKNENEAIMAAFDKLEPYYLEYVTGRFIGVHTDNLDFLVAEQTAGYFREGSITRVRAQV